MLLALDQRPWSSAEDLAVANLPSSSSVTNRVLCHLSALCCSASNFTLVQTSHIAERKFSCRMEGVLARLLLPDSAQIAAATADLRTAFKQVRIYQGKGKGLG